jgi:hypothetical protein
MRGVAAAFEFGGEPKATAELGELTRAAIWLEVLRSTHQHLPDDAGVDMDPPARPLAGLGIAKGKPFAPNAPSGASIPSP